MWPFRKTPIVVTNEQLAIAVAEFAQTCGNYLSTELQNYANQKWQLESTEIASMGNEIFVASLWMVSKALRPDKALLDSLHDGYFESCYHSGATHEEGKARAEAAQSELGARYRQYHQAWDKDAKGDGGLALGSEMANCFFPKRKPVMDAQLCMLISIHTGVVMKRLLKLRADYKLKAA